MLNTFSRCVPYEEIAEQDYNLSVSTYVEAKDTREKIDIVKLNAEIAEIVAREQVLREEIDRIIRGDRGMSNIEELKSLNKLNRGIHKHWIWGNENNFFLVATIFKRSIIVFKHSIQKFAICPHRL